MSLFLAAFALTMVPMWSAGATVDSPAAVDAAATPGVRVANCADYTPHDLAISVPQAAPGETVTISGIGAPGDTVTIRISTLNGPPIVLGTAVVSAAGFFSTQITIPASFQAGTYQITVTSAQCSDPSTITIVITATNAGCRGRQTVRARRGDIVTWVLRGQFDTTKPITVTLVPNRPGPSVVVYSGAYPANGKITFTVPQSLHLGVYRIVESGFNNKGKPRSARCGRLVVRKGGGGGSSTVPSSSSSTPSSSSSIPSSSSSTPSSSSSIPSSSSSTPSSSSSIPSSSSSTPSSSSSIPSSSSSTPSSSSSIPTSTTTPASTTTVAGTSTTSSTSSTTTSTSSTSTTAATTTTAAVTGSSSSTSVPTQVLGADASRGVNTIGSGTTPVAVLGDDATRDLATTGSTVRPYIVGGAALIAAGALLLLGARRRRD